MSSSTQSSLSNQNSDIWKENKETSSCPIAVPPTPSIAPQMIPAFLIQVVSQPDLKRKNVIWMNEDDYQFFFNKQPDESLGFDKIQIRGLIYRVMLGTLPRGWLSIPEHHLKSFDEVIFDCSGMRSVVATPYRDFDNSYPTLSEIHLDMIRQMHPLSEGGIQTAAYESVEKEVRHLLSKELIVPGNSFFLKLPYGDFELFVSKLQSEEEQKEPSNLPYKIDFDHTKIVINSLSLSKLQLADQIYQGDQIKHLDFSLQLKKRNLKADNESLPLVFCEKKIRSDLLKAFQGLILAAGNQKVISNVNGWDLEVEFRRGVLNKEENDGKFNHDSVDTIEGFILDDSTKITFDVADPKSIVLSDYKSKPAKKLSFEVVSVSESRWSSNDVVNQRWISINEFNQAVKELQKSFVEREVFPLHLSTGKYMVKVFLALPENVEKPNQVEEQKSETPLYINEETELELQIIKGLQLTKVVDENSVPLESVTVSVNRKYKTDSLVYHTTDDIRALILGVAPKKLVKKLKFDGTTAQGDRLGFEISDLRFPNPPNGSGIRPLGKITKETSMNLYSGFFSALHFVDRVYSDEVKQFRFLLEVKKVDKAAKTTKLPLIADSEQLISEINERIQMKYAKERPYLIVGDQVSIRKDTGWKIVAELTEVILKPGVDEGNLELSESRTIKGYAYPIKSIKFEREVAELLLTRGQPKTASVLNFSIENVVRDYVDDDVIDKGSWVNLKELKDHLLKDPSPFVVKELRTIELSTGMYHISLKSAIPVQKAVKDEEYKGAILDEEPIQTKNMLLQIDEDTVINLDSGIYHDLQVVKNSDVYPLKKVVFEVAPENKSERIQTMTHQDLKEALLSLKPDKLTKSIALKLDTASGISVTLTMKELEFNKEHSSINEDEVYLSITEETHLVFQGEKDAKLCIDTPPKILDIKNPIKYLEELGLGGIEKQFQHLSRIFFSRSQKLRREVEKRGGKPIKGVMLYGPPGTGKTTLARSLGELLGCTGDRCNLITATEMKNMWFGQSESNIRKLFEPAEEAQKKFGKKSPLYMVIIDEIDALLPRRGNSPNKVNDSLVNQFLGCMDGLKLIENLLVIGITNRKEDIDPAALRHGRFGVHIEMGLPEEKARKKIFEIHARTLIENNLLSDNINFQALAEITEGDSGAEIEGIVKEAANYSLERLDMLDCPVDQLEGHEAGNIVMEDFEKALKERKGDKASKLALSGPPKFLQLKDHTEYLEKIGLGGLERPLKKLQQVFLSRTENDREKAPLIKSILLHGPHGNGKSALAAHLSELFGCHGNRIKMTSSFEILKSLREKEGGLKELFEPAKRAHKRDGNKSLLYMVVIDDVDALLPTSEKYRNKSCDPIISGMFLDCLDEVKDFDNILVVGITSRKDYIDPSVLRKGRFAHQIEVGMPNFEARKKIFEIHSKHLIESGQLAKDVDFDILADKTSRYYSGGDIENIVKMAEIHAIEGQDHEESKEEDFLVTLHDFEAAIIKQKDILDLPPPGLHV
ncbi:MAG: AAA family ATPase [Waddliaceae bacterium]